MNYDEIKERQNQSNVYTPDNKKVSTPYITVDTHAALFKYIAIAVAVVGFVAGIICGAVMPVIELDYLGFDVDDEAFNFVAMLVVWIITAASTLGCWTVYCILDSMDNMLIELTRANHYHKQNTEKE